MLAAGDIDTVIISLTMDNGAPRQHRLRPRIRLRLRPTNRSHGRKRGGLRVDNEHHRRPTRLTAAGFLAAPLRDNFIDRFAASYRAQTRAFIAACRDRRPPAPSAYAKPPPPSPPPKPAQNHSPAAPTKKLTQRSKAMKMLINGKLVRRKQPAAGSAPDPSTAASSTPSPRADADDIENALTAATDAAPRHGQTAGARPAWPPSTAPPTKWTAKSKPSPKSSATKQANRSPKPAAKPSA